MSHLKDWQQWLRPKGVPPKPLEDRLWSKVQKNSPNGCWIWTGGVANHGYGEIGVGSRVGGAKRTKLLVHRLVYELLVGEIPDGLDIDHLCRNKICVNPAHLEPVTRRENLARGNGNITKTHCPQGHPYDEANTYRKKSRYGFQRICRTCERRRQRRYDAAHRAFKNL